MIRCSRFLGSNMDFSFIRSVRSGYQWLTQQSQCTTCNRFRRTTFIDASRLTTEEVSQFPQSMVPNFMVGAAASYVPRWWFQICLEFFTSKNGGNDRTALINIFSYGLKPKTIVINVFYLFDIAKIETSVAKPVQPIIQKAKHFPFFFESNVWFGIYSPQQRQYIVPLPNTSF